jgi:hypothetical protein
MLILFTGWAGAADDLAVKERLGRRGRSGQKRQGPDDHHAECEPSFSLFGHLFLLIARAGRSAWGGGRLVC